MSRSSAFDKIRMQVRHIGDDGKVNEYQVVVKVAFELK